MDPVEKYFNAERAECLIGIFIGIASLIVGIFAQAQGSDFYRGLAYTFFGAGLVQLIVCSVVVARAPKDIVRVNGYIENDRSKIQSEEIPRVIEVLKNFVTYRRSEIGLLILGPIFYFLLDGDRWRGAGLGLLLNAALLLFFDYFAERRGKAYLEYLKSIN